MGFWKLSYSCTKTEVRVVAGRGDLDVVKWLHENRKERSKEAMNAAAWCGKLEIFKWLYENRTDGNPAQALERARCYKRHNVVDYLSRIIANQ
jgi:hypothetical protein